MAIADLPQQTQAPAWVGCSPSGRQRIVAELSSLTRASHAMPAHHGAATNPAPLAEVLDHLVIAARVAQRPPLLFLAGGLQEGRLDVAQQLVDRGSRASERDLLLVAAVAARDGDR